MRTAGTVTAGTVTAGTVTAGTVTTGVETGGVVTVGVVIAAVVTAGVLTAGVTVCGAEDGGGWVGAEAGGAEPDGGDDGSRAVVELVDVAVAGAAGLPLVGREGRVAWPPPRRGGRSAAGRRWGSSPARRGAGRRSAATTADAGAPGTAGAVARTAAGRSGVATRAVAAAPGAAPPATTMAAPIAGRACSTAPACDALDAARSARRAANEPAAAVRTTGRPGGVHAQERGHGVAVELPARLAAQDVERSLMGRRRAIGARGRQRVEGVGHRDDPGADRDVVTGQAVGVPGPHALVMVTDDRADLGVGGGLEQRGAVNRVAHDHLELGVGQPAGLVEDLPGRVDLADVVHQRPWRIVSTLAAGRCSALAMPWA